MAKAISKKTTPVIKVDNLRMHYGATNVLNGIHFEVKKGEVVVLLGPNGAGKTTTIEILEGFRVRSGGDVTVLGIDPTKGGEEWRARLGVVLQSWRDHTKWKVAELLTHLGEYYTPFSTQTRKRPMVIGDLIELVGLEPLANTQIKALSGGQRRRLDVAIGLIGKPDVLFLDEPTASFDPQAKREFHDVIHRLVDLEDTTILLTTHDLDEAEKLADRILILANGKIVADGSAEKLARQVSSQAEVRWSRNGEFFVHPTPNATEFVRKLFAQHGQEIGDLEVRRASLEETYISLVHQYEVDHKRNAISDFGRKK